MNKKKAIFAVFVLIVAAAVISIAAQESRLITSASAGNVRIGMSVAEAGSAMPGYTLERTSDGEGIALIAIKKGSDRVMVLFAGEEDPEKPVDYGSKIEHIEVLSRDYKTAAGIYPGMKVSAAEKVLGKISEIIISEIEAREFATFANQPEGIAFRLMGENGMAGDYARGSSKTNKYARDAFIFSISISGMPQAAEYTSEYTDLGTECKTEEMSKEAQHSSSYCRGFGGYRVHIFDSATTLEIRAVSDDGSVSVPIASQSLSYQLKGRKLEWRLKNGMPVAVIMRGFTYERGADGLIRYPEKITGEYLFVKGLAGNEKIDYQINVKDNKNANETARGLADSRFVDPVIPFEFVPFADYNKMISEAISRREAWVRSVMGIVMKLAGEFVEIKTRTIEIEAPFAEEIDELKVTVTDDGYLDDSVRGEKTVFILKRGTEGSWKVSVAYRSRRCWEGRGHQDYSAEPCI